METYYKLLSAFIIGLFFVLTGCQEGEVLNLTEYPINQPTMTISDTEGKSNITLAAVYNSEGLLELNGPVSRTYTFHFTASPQDATVTFELIHTNIPEDIVEISMTKATIPAGSTDVTVEVTLKDEDFSFATSNYDAETYELGVKAIAEGYKMQEDPIESKVIIEKEAYKASCLLVGEHGNEVSFKRIYSEIGITNTESISYSFNVKLDKPARKDLKVNLAVTGLEKQFMENITVTPTEIIIPAGQVESEKITWSITDDFLLSTFEPEEHILVVTASVESEDPVVIMDEEKNTLTFNVYKVFQNFYYVNEKAAEWIELDKTDWVVDLDPTVYSGQASYLIDGLTNQYVYKSKTMWFVIDMQTKQAITGVGIDHRYSGVNAQKVTILTSLDNENWATQGTVEVSNAKTIYFQFYAPQTVRYVKFELLRNTGSLYVTEAYIYNNTQ